MMKATRENYHQKGQLAHVEKEQVDIKADIKIMQHDIAAIKETMATKADIIGLRSELKTEISDLRSELKTDISELKSSVLKWNVSLFIAGLTINLAAIGVVAALIAK